MQEFNSQRQSEHLIHDISARRRTHTKLYSLRDDRVQHLAIGYLDDLYSGSGKGDGNRQQRHYAPIAEPTRIPPLTTLIRPRESVSVLALVSSLELTLSEYTNRARIWLATMWLAIVGYTRSLPWFPKRYAVSKGVFTDWHTATFRRTLWTMPAIIGLLVAAFIWNDPAVTPQPGSSPERQPVVSAQLTTATKPDSQSTGTSSGTSANGDTTWTGPTDTPTYSVSSNPSNVSAPAIGGLGGGDTSGVLPAVPTPVEPPSTPVVPVDPTPTTPLDPILDVITMPLEPVTDTVDGL